MRAAKRSFLLAALVVIFLSGLFSLGFLDGWQHTLSDSLFVEKEPLDDIVIIAIDDHSLQEIGRWPWERDTYIPLFEHLQDARVVGLDVAFFEPAPGDTQLGATMRQTGNVVIPEELDFSRNTLLKPSPGYENITTGFVNIFSDADGVARTTPLEYHNRTSFALAIYETWRGRDISPPQNPLRINYVGPPFTFEVVSFADALEHNFSGKIVLIGATAPDLHDDAFVPTSQGRAMPGVEIHANALQTLITQKYLTKAPSLLTFAILILVAMIITLILLHFSLTLSSIFSLGLVIFYTILAITLFDKGIILNIVYPTLTAILVYIALVANFYVQEFLERQRVKNIFGKYVSPHLAEHILATTEKEDIKLEGEERDVALLFADIRGFTSMSEKMTPREVVTMLNRYLGAMTKSVFDNNGTLDKYMGDCIMAIFGAPVSSENPTLDAVKCALDMQRLVKEVSKESGIPKIGLGIGINFGEAIVGNMGSKERAEYTAIGDTVNTASRMCSASEGGEIKLPKESYERVKEFVEAKYVGEIKVKGKTKPIKVYEVKGLKNA